MKPREPRRKIVVPARIRQAGRWADVRILDASSRGFMIHLPNAPPRGTYVELHRGRRSYVARVVWQSAQRCGLQTQDRVIVDDLVKPPEAVTDPRQDEAPTIERRSAGRARDRIELKAERSRTSGRAGQFAAFICGAVVAASLLYGMVGQALSRPLAQVSTALTR